MKTELNDNLKQRWNDLLARNPKLRIRDAARELGVSEVELLATGCGDTVTRLAGDWTALIREFPRLGRVMCLTRNDSAVHERYGVFSTEIAFFSGMGQVVGTDIDLRLFMSHWHAGFAVLERDREKRLKHSLQFFDFDGTAVFKLFLTEGSHPSVYEELVKSYVSPDQSAAQVTGPVEKAAPEKPDSEIDVSGFHVGWKSTKDTHEFFGLTKKFGVSREQALRLAPEGYAWRVELGVTKALLERAAGTRTPIMIFVGNAGCIQIHTGLVNNIKPFGAEWLNVLDDDFNLHLYEPGIVSAWVVRKVTGDGFVTSMELYDREGGNVALFFGKRKPGQVEDEAWRNLVLNLPRLS
jgi:putative hemin transport protein